MVAKSWKKEKAELLKEVIRLHNRLADEQRNARDLLQYCGGRGVRKSYLYQSYIHDEQKRLNGNIKIAENNAQIYQNQLVEMAGE